MKFIWFTILPLSFFLFNCDDQVFQSSWINKPVIIDGHLNEWDSLMQKADTRSSIGIMNDSQFLYLCITSDSPELFHQIIHRGFIVTIKNNDKKSGFFAVKYIMNKPSEHPHPEFADSQPHPPRFEDLLSKIEIYNKDNENDKYPVTIPVANKMGIETCIITDGRSLSCEMKFPLSNDSLHPFAINSTPSNTIQLTIETNQIEQDGQSFERHGPPEAMAGKGMPQRGGLPSGNGPPPGMPQGNKGPERSDHNRNSNIVTENHANNMAFEPISYKLQVQLANNIK